jgi:hypothetical protein
MRVALGERGEKAGEDDQEHESHREHQPQAAPAAVERLHLWVEPYGSLDGRHIEPARLRGCVRQRRVRWPDGQYRRRRRRGRKRRRGRRPDDLDGGTAFQFFHTTLQIADCAVERRHRLGHQRAYVFARLGRRSDRLERGRRSHRHGVRLGRGRRGDRHRDRLARRRRSALRRRGRLRRALRGGGERHGGRESLHDRRRLLDERRPVVQALERRREWFSCNRRRRRLRRRPGNRRGGSTRLKLWRNGRGRRNRVRAASERPLRRRSMGARKRSRLRGGHRGFDCRRLRQRPRSRGGPLCHTDTVHYSAATRQLHRAPQTLFPIMAGSKYPQVG